MHTGETSDGGDDAGPPHADRLVAVLEIGSMLAGYRIQGIVGTGQMATVYLAQSPDLPRHDALKVANSQVLADEALQARFLREADVGATLTHPHIVPIHRRGQDDGLLWIAMHYVSGGDAETALIAGTITASRAVEIIADIAKALDYAHSQGVIHRDVKPANFLIAGDGRVLLGDFGIAHRWGEVDAPDSIAATLAYAAPEVLSGQHIDGRADVYSLGCSLFRLLTGRTPFPSGDTAAVIAHHLNDPIPAVSDFTPDIPAAMDAVIARALAKDPADRYSTAGDLAAAAAHALHPPAPASPGPTTTDDSPSPARPPAPAPAIQPTVRPVVQSPPNPSPRPGSTPKPLAPFEIPRPAPDSSPPRDRDHARLLRVGGAALAAVTLAVTVGMWLTSGREDDSAQEPASDPSAAATTSPPTRSPAAEARLLRELPPGYPTDACRAVTPAAGAQATLECSVTPAPDQPQATVTHLLLPSRAALKDAFDQLLSTSTVVLCPGNIASPGPWRRNATPGQISGTLACGFQQDHAIVAWTTDSALRLSTVTAPQTGTDGTLDPIYSWWMMHS